MKLMKQIEEMAQILEAFKLREMKSIINAELEKKDIMRTVPYLVDALIFITQLPRLQENLLNQDF